MLRRILIGLSVLFALLVMLFVVVRTPDISHDVLAERYGSPASQYLELPSGGRAHVRAEGLQTDDAPTLLLVHGSNASLHTWEGWVAELSARARVISVDLPGHGLTGGIPSEDYSRDAMICFLEEVRTLLGIDSWSVAGNSMGGGVAMAYALQHPRQVESLILVDAGGVAVPRGEAESSSEAEPKEERRGAIGFRLMRSPIFGRLLEHVAPRGIIEQGVRAAHGDPEAVSDDVVDRYFELQLHPGNRRATRLRFAATGRAPLDVERIEQPTLILFGEEDNLIPVAAGHRQHELIADSELIVYEGIGHVPMEEIPERSAADAFGFLERRVWSAPIEASAEEGTATTALP